MSQSNLKIRMKLQLIWTSITTTPTCLFPPRRKALHCWLPQRQCKLTTVQLSYREEITGTSITAADSENTAHHLENDDSEHRLTVTLSRLDTTVTTTGCTNNGHRTWTQDVSDCQKWTSQCYLDVRIICNIKIDQILEQFSPYFIQKVTLTLFLFNANPVHIYAVSLLN